MGDIRLLYEDEEALVLDKPAGLLVHPDGRRGEPTLSEWVRERYPALVGVGEPLRLASGETVDRPGIVHRLDRETSGAIVVAKSPASFAALKRQFQSRAVAKVYNAFLHGELAAKEGTIDRPIGKSRSDFRKRSAQPGARGKLREAATDYRVLLARKGFSFVEAMPRTGRTHQIRVHMKAIHHPVVCDSLYGGKLGCALGFARLALHARKISFETLRGKVEVEAPLPPDFERALAELSR